MRGLVYKRLPIHPAFLSRPNERTVKVAQKPILFSALQGTNKTSDKGGSIGASLKEQVSMRTLVNRE
jgi:hypothetical protein